MGKCDTTVACFDLGRGRLAGNRVPPARVCLLFILMIIGTIKKLTVLMIIQSETQRLQPKFAIGWFQTPVNFQGKFNLDRRIGLLGCGSWTPREEIEGEMWGRSRTSHLEIVIRLLLQTFPRNSLAREYSLNGCPSRGTKGAKKKIAEKTKATVEVPQRNGGRKHEGISGMFSVSTQFLWVQHALPM